ncbi:MAG: hypothetical protein ABII71_04165 [Candidatus Micrarchaeota archaeon]
MAFLYIYDLKAKNKHEFGRLKRIFYYHLAKLNLGRELWKTKSAFAVPEGKEISVDAFFKRFRGSVEVYKAFVLSIEELE